VPQQSFIEKAIMRLTVSVVSFSLLVSSANVQAFTAPLALTRVVGQQQQQRVQQVPVVALKSTAADSATESTKAVSSSSAKPKPTLGLLTFDLDDTLYPVDPVINEANKAFANAMARFGYTGIQPIDIVNTGKRIREEMDPEEAAILTHTEIRELAIRREMEQFMLKRKLQETADDWATPVSDLGDIIVKNAKKWAKTSVSPSIVNAVLIAWEMERHHAAERHLYPELMDILQEIKDEHPGVIIGAVTDGRANPMFMTFTLQKYFDFCMSWEDDQGARSKFFKELAAVEGDAELSWIYNAAFEKYQDLASAAAAIDAAAPAEAKKMKPEKGDPVWIHVGDDLAYDVGGSAACGAKTIYMELNEKYGQTARHRFEGNQAQPAWSTSLQPELDSRRVMNELAKEHVDQKVAFLSQLPEAINKILGRD
jgi:FMN phosphatase YigB (HAD superfamily)